MNKPNRTSEVDHNELDIIEEREQLEVSEFHVEDLREFLG